MSVKPLQPEKTHALRLSVTAFILLMLDSVGKMKVNEEFLHSLSYMVQSQMKDGCYPTMNWTIRSGLIFSSEVEKGLQIARRQGLVSAPPSVNLTATGRRHCSLLGVSVEHCRNDLREATAYTLGVCKDEPHSLCTAAAALASGFDKSLLDRHVLAIIKRHSRFMTRLGHLTNA